MKRKGKRERKRRDKRKGKKPWWKELEMKKRQ